LRFLSAREIKLGVIPPSAGCSIPYSPNGERDWQRNKRKDDNVSKTPLNKAFLSIDNYFLEYRILAYNSCHGCYFTLNWIKIIKTKGRLKAYQYLQHWENINII